jgi:hypothetical protein
VTKAQISGLFTPVPQPPQRSVPLADTTPRSRLVTIDLRRLRRVREVVSGPSGETIDPKDTSTRADKAIAEPEPGATLLLNLDEDVTVTGIVEWTAPTLSGGYSLSGRLSGEPPGAMTLVVNGERVVGTVMTPDRTYRIRSVGEGLHIIGEVSHPPLECDVDEPHANVDRRNK